MKAEAIADIHNIKIAVAGTEPLVILIASAASALITPVSTSAPTRTNRPAKKKIASHSILLKTLAIIASLSVAVISSKRPAPVKAQVADSRPNIPWRTNRVIVKARTPRHLLRSLKSVILLRASILITLSRSSGWVCNSDLYIISIMPTVTAKINIAGAVRLTTKSPKLRPTAEPIIMLGGSPISVEVPPILDDIICAMRNGLTSTLSC